MDRKYMAIEKAKTLKKKWLRHLKIEKANTKNNEDK